MSKLAYEYRLKLNQEQQHTFKNYRRGSQFIQNRAIGERFDYMEWQRSFSDKPLPTGVWESDYTKNSGIIIEIEKTQRDLLKVEAELVGLTGFSQEQIDKRNSLKKKQQTLLKKLPGLLKKLDKLHKLSINADLKEEVRKDVERFNLDDEFDFNELKCDRYCTLSLEDIETRDPEYNKLPRHKTKHVDFYSQKAKLAKNHPESLTREPITTLRGEVIDLSFMHSMVRQEAMERVEKSFDRWLYPDKNGNRSGKPRFKTFSDVTSFSIPVAGLTKVAVVNVQINSKGKTDKEKYRTKYAELEVPNKISKSNIRIIYHRPLPENSKIKRATFVRKADGWYVCLTLELKSKDKKGKDKAHPTTENTVGFDAVLNGDIYLAGSDNTKYKSSKLYRKNQEHLASLQRKEDELSSYNNYTLVIDGNKKRRQYKDLHTLKELGRIRNRIKRLQQRIARQRKHVQYQIAHHIAKNEVTQFVVLEDLNIKALIKHNKKKYNSETKSYDKNGQSAKSGLAKSFLDAAFYQFSTILGHVLNKYGKELHKVDPKYTSKYLCYKDEVVFNDCSVRDYYDENLGTTIDRDCNAGVNIARKFLKIFPAISTKGGGTKITKSYTEQFSDIFIDKLSKPLVIIPEMG